MVKPIQTSRPGLRRSILAAHIASNERRRDLLMKGGTVGDSPTKTPFLNPPPNLPNEKNTKVEQEGYNIATFGRTSVFKIIDM